MLRAVISLSSLLFLTIAFWKFLKVALNQGLEEKKNRYAETDSEFARLCAESLKLKTENAELSKKAEETMQLYDITKEISKYLDDEKIFSCFKEHLERYVSIEDCRFLKKKEEALLLKGHAITPFRLKDESEPFGYLAVRGLKEEEKDKFNILTNQFMLGLKRAVLYKQVQELSITDTLTGVFTRRYYLERFKEEFERSKKFNYSFSLLMIDIDHFKEYNDRFGHLVGDKILKELSLTIKENVRQIDILGRYGGEEFSVVLTETAKDEAVIVAERIRQAVQEKSLKAYDEDLNLTISIGVCSYPQDSENLSELIDKADYALYRSKDAGRNKVSSC